jgi:chromosome segregation ATPase
MANAARLTAEGDGNSLEHKMEASVKRIIIPILAALSLASCASMWKTMGVATEASVSAKNAELAQQVGGLKASVDEIAAVTSEISNLRKDIDQLAPLSQELQDLKSRIDELSAKVEKNDSALAEVATLKGLLGELQGKMDSLPAETLRKLAGILAKAVEELPSGDQQP